MKIVAISDVHNKWHNLEIPECDVLISCGDYSFKGEEHVVKSFHEWMNKQEAGYFISVQGNHELWVEKNFEKAKAIAQKACPGVHFIGTGETVNIEGVNFYGSAVTPYFHSWAWNVHRGPAIKAHWDKIPDNTDVLITHGMPLNLLDEVMKFGVVTNVGCEDLLIKMQSLPQLKHYFGGHTHLRGGTSMTFNGVQIHNAAICDEEYNATRTPIIIEI